MKCDAVEFRLSGRSKRIPYGASHGMSSKAVVGCANADLHLAEGHHGGFIIVITRGDCHN